MSILTKEGIQKILNDDWLLMDDCEGLENCTVIKELARMALDAMDNEPVAWTDEEELRDVNVAGIGYLFGIDREANKFADPRRQIMLYRHAQQPVVPPEQHWEELCREYPDMSIGDAIIRAAWWNHCRAAMLQSGTLTNEDTRQVDELTMWIKRLVRSLKNANPDSKLPRDAMDYLTAKGLISVGDVLR
ncbi:TPA: hypothetical protein ACTXCG_002973 [Klebsiella michiganensis]